MRSIDADELKKDIEENAITLNGVSVIEVDCAKALIDIAPTVEPEIKQIEDLINSIWDINFDFGDYYDHTEEIRQLVFNAIHEAFGDKEEEQEEEEK